MSDDQRGETPRTDAAVDSSAKLAARDMEGAWMQMVYFARDLERELAEAKERYDALHIQLSAQEDAQRPSTAAPVAWIIEESMRRLRSGGNDSRGSVPVHAEKKGPARHPLYAAAPSPTAATEANAETVELDWPRKAWAGSPAPSAPQPASAVAPSAELKIAEDAINMFLEYRDKHGHNEESAKAQALNEFAEAAALSPPAPAARNEVLAWLDANTTFYDVDADWPVEGHNISTLAQVSNRIWYHATDDLLSWPFSKVIEHALRSTSAPAAQDAQDAARYRFVRSITTLRNRGYGPSGCWLEGGTEDLPWDETMIGKSTDNEIIDAAIDAAMRAEGADRG